MFVCLHQYEDLLSDDALDEENESRDIEDNHSEEHDSNSTSSNSSYL